jgi:hypothetical protein
MKMRDFIKRYMILAQIGMESFLKLLTIFCLIKKATEEAIF